MWSLVVDTKPNYCFEAIEFSEDGTKLAGIITSSS
jgi:hypothetical protein